jgi:DNA invertase Pin-like site-specific DNA recombinase
MPSADQVPINSTHSTMRSKSASCVRLPRERVAKSFTSTAITRRDKRPQFDKLCRDATNRQFDVVMAWSVDRLGRSLQGLVEFLTEIHGRPL